MKLLIVMRKEFVLSFEGCEAISVAKSAVHWRRKEAWWRICSEVRSVIFCCARMVGFDCG